MDEVLIKIINRKESYLSAPKQNISLLLLACLKTHSYWIKAIARFRHASVKNGCVSICYEYVTNQLWLQIYN